VVLEYAPDGHLLYVRLREGEVVETDELEEIVYVDLDAEGRPVGVEFLDAAAFFPFLDRWAGERRHVVVGVPAGLRDLLDAHYGVVPDGEGGAGEEPVGVAPVPAVEAGRSHEERRRVKRAG